MKGRSRPAREGEGTLVLVLVLAILSLLASCYLNHLHYKVHTDAGFSSACALSEDVNCETVALSSYSTFLGLPVSYWGITVDVLYILLAGLGLLDTRRERKVRGWSVLLLMSVAGVAISALLFSVAHFVIESLCPYCMAVYVINVALAAVVAIHLVRRRRSLRDIVLTDVRSFLGGPPLAILAVPALMIGLAYALYPRIYDTGTCPGRTESELCTEPSTYGNPDAPVTIMEYSDYECPFCGMTHFSLRRAVETYPDDVVLVHVHFPLDMACNDLVDRPFHENSCEAARAAVCAQRQGRFWEYNDYLFTHQKQIGRVPYERIAEKLDLDVPAFESCMSDPASLEAVEEDIERAKKTPFVEQGQVGTPIITINGKGHMGAIHWEDLERYLRQNFDLSSREEDPHEK